MESFPLSAPQAQNAFDEVVHDLPRQHLRTRFRNHFGSAEVTFDVNSFARGSQLVERDKPVGNLLQERPESLKVAVVSRDENGFFGTGETTSSEGTLGEAVPLSDAPQVFIVLGAKAKLVGYADPAVEGFYVRRLVVEIPKEPKPAQRKSRRQRAMAANPGGRPPARGGARNAKRGRR